SQPLEPLFVVLGKRSACFIDAFKYADDVAVPVVHRHAQEIARQIAAQLVDIGIESGIGIGVGNVDDLSGTCSQGDDGVALDGQVNGVMLFQTLLNLGPCLAFGGLENEDATAIA